MVCCSLKSATTLLFADVLRDNALYYYYILLGIKSKVLLRPHPGLRRSFALPGGRALPSRLGEGRKRHVPLPRVRQDRSGPAIAGLPPDPSPKATRDRWQRGE